MLYVKLLLKISGIAKLLSGSSRQTLKNMGYEYQGYELDRLLTEFKFERYLRVRVQVLRILFFEFKFQFGENDRVQRVRVRSPDAYA